MKNCLRPLKTLFVAIIVACGFLPAITQAAYTPPSSNHADFNFNYDWLFLKSNPNGGASATTYSETGWQAVSLPHTWSDDLFREWVFDSNDTKADPLRSSGSYNGIAWYRKHFTLPTTYSGRQIILEFQGITYIGTFYVNGQQVLLSESAFGPTGVDITPYVTFGADNVIAVAVNNNQNYQTVGYNGDTIPAGVPFNVNMGGINRDVTLHITDKVHLTKPLYRGLGTQGTYIFPSNIDTLNKTGTVNIQAEVKNDNTTAQTVTCSSVVVDATGTVVQTLSGGSQSIAAGQKFVFNEAANMTGIHFWDPTYPYLYKVYTQLTVGGNVVDVDQITTGFRTYVFNPNFGLEVNGHYVYLNGYAPRASMEWPAVGTPVDWMNEYDFAQIKQTNANFMRPMQCAPHLTQVEAADKYGVIMVVPSAYSEDDQPDPNKWQEDLDIMRDLTIYFRNNPSVLFYEACNGQPSAQHMSDMLAIRKTWDPSGGRLAGARTNDGDATQGIREYSGSMDGSEDQLATPLFDCEYGRAEGPRRVWDEYTPMYNPRWDGVNKSLTPFKGTNTTSKYLIGGYFNIASDYHQNFGFYGADGTRVPPDPSVETGYGMSDFIGEYLTPVPQANGSFSNAYFRVNNSEDMLLENLGKYYGRLNHSYAYQSTATSATKGVMVGGAKIIWSDSWTDGRMHDMEVSRTSGVVDGVRLPKEVYYGMQVAQNPNPQVYVVGHWNYAAGTTKTVYVCSNTPQTTLMTYDTNGNLLHDYTSVGTKAFFPSSILSPNGDQVNNFVVAYPGVAWQAGKIVAQGLDASGNVLYTHTKTTVGAPDHIKLTTATGPSGWMADGSDIAWYDVEVVDANGNRCPTYQDNVTFSCSGQGVFLGGYNNGIRYSTNLANLTSGYSLQIESGINRVFVRSTRTAGQFTLNVTGVNNVTNTNFPTATASVTSTAVVDTAGLSTVWPQKYSPALGTEPTPVVEGVAPPSVTQIPVAPATDITSYQYTGGKAGSTVIENVQAGQKVYVDQAYTLPTLPAYLQGAEFIQPYQSDAGDTSATDQYGFNLSKFSYIYLAIDAANNMPNNDSNSTYQWQLMPDTFQVHGRTMNIYKSRLMQPHENALLADNAYQNAARFSSSSNMYLVFVQNVEQQLVNPAQTIIASSTQAANVAANAIDGNTSTHWNASDGTFPQTVVLDLGQEMAIGGYTLNIVNNATRFAEYKIDVSDDNSTYSTSLDMSQNQLTGVNEFLVPSIGSFVGRYVRITFEGMSSGASASLSELQIYGVPASLLASDSSLVSGSATSTASSSATGHTPDMANDADTTTYWTASGTTYPQTWTVDLGQVQALTNVDITWLSGSSQAYAYKIDVSSDNATYTNVSTQASNTVVGQTTDNFLANGRYVRVTVTGSSVSTVAAGAYDISVSGTDPSAPLITSDLVVSTNATVAFNYQITGLNLPTSFTATGLPSGLTLNSTTGVISGTPGTSQIGNHAITLGATNAAGTDHSTLNLTILSAPIPPVVNSPTTATATVATSYSYQITGTNIPSSYAATGLPAGLTLDPVSGIISGTPLFTATSTVGLTATNPYGTSPKVNLTLNVVAGAYSNLSVGKTVTASSTKSATANLAPAACDGNGSTRWESAYTDNEWIQVDLGATSTIHTIIIDWQNAAGKNYTIQGSTDKTNWVDIATPVTNNSTTGIISYPGLFASERYVRITGTDRITAYGYSIFELQVWGVAGSNGSEPTVDGNLSPAGVAGSAFSYQITATSSPTSYTATGLPAGLSLNSSTGVISGVPTAQGVSAVTVTATNSHGTSPAATVNISINPEAPAITSQLTAAGQLTVGFNYHILATNTPTAFTATPLPPGLTLNASSGAITGTPTTIGTTNVTITASNITGTSAPATLVITITDVVPSITSPLTATGKVGTGFSYATQATNTPTSYAATGLPPNLNLNAVTGAISGTPTTAGTSNVTLTATNSHGTGPASTLVITIDPLTPAINSPLVAQGIVGSSFSYQITASSSPTSYAATGLPGGLSVNGTSGLISGSPTASGTFNVSLTASNSGGTSPAATLVLTINPAGTDINVGLNHTPIASSAAAGNLATAANDGSTTTRWAATDGTVPQYWQVDLGSNKTVSRVDMNLYSNATRYSQYTIQTSTDNLNFTTRINKSTNTTVGLTSDTFTAPVTARYVKVNFTKVSSGFVSAYEIGVFGH